MTTEAYEIKKAHQTLLAAYVDVLNQGTSLSYIVKMNAVSWAVDITSLNSDIANIKPTIQSIQVARKSIWGKLFIWLYDQIYNWSFLEIPAFRYLISLFISSHFKAKLNELSISYLYQAQKYDGNSDESAKIRTWFLDASEMCGKLSGTLASFQSIQGAISAFWPVVAGALATFLGTGSLWDAIKVMDIGTIISWSVFFLLPLLYLLIFLITSFLYKRQMFTGYDPITELKSYIKSQEITDIELLSTEKNIYLLENRLFLLLGRSKTGEFPWDLFIFPITISGMLLFWEWPKNFVISDWKLIALSAIFFVFALAIKRRKWY